MRSCWTARLRVDRHATTRFPNVLRLDELPLVRTATVALASCTEAVSSGCAQLVDATSPKSCFRRRKSVLETFGESIRQTGRGWIRHFSCGRQRTVVEERSAVTAGTRPGRSKSGRIRGEAFLYCLCRVRRRSSTPPFGAPGAVCGTNGEANRPERGRIRMRPPKPSPGVPIPFAGTVRCKTADSAPLLPACPLPPRNRHRRRLLVPGR